MEATEKMLEVRIDGAREAAKRTRLFFLVLTIGLRQEMILQGLQV